ncbi:putative galactoside-binding lectin [Nephila pilipes]|uniref:Putative galactoside-binding lectin n=1 Tax=Nephila pilipes TaxID=299642 RepID=A0A8X6T466_NEPPI|nr:putative galactoside-binding lectin [Nephila pilipes]
MRCIMEHIVFQSRIQSCFMRSSAAPPEAVTIVLKRDAPETTLRKDCQVSYATEAVMSSCHGRRKCSIGADVGTFGKPGCPPGTRLFLKVVHTCVPKEILKDLDIGGSEESKDQEDSDYTGFIEEPRYVPPVTSGPLVEANQPKPTLKPQLGEFPLPFPSLRLLNLSRALATIIRKDRTDYI